jgi:hypothetical protein
VLGLEIYTGAEDLSRDTDEASVCISERPGFRLGVCGKTIVAR